MTNKKWTVEIEVVGDGDIFNTNLMKSITTHGEERVIVEDCYVVNNIQMIEDKPAIYINPN